ncbi:MAG: CPBP family intramembrane metalloprotease [Clostridiales bacterium]|jgi:membrane protease YdiL (CAAX protease family)|nr:CPBP family intramembrane metalloprotease [Clostridiales bacterium]
MNTSNENINNEPPDNKAAVFTARPANRYMLGLSAYSILVHAAISYIFGKLGGYPQNLMAVQIAFQLVLLVPPLVVFVRLSGAKMSEVLPFRKVGAVNVLLIIGMALFIQPLLMIFSAAAMFFFKNEVSDFMQAGIAQANPVLCFVALAVAPPVLEEASFRGAAYFGAKTPLLHRVLLTSLFFGLGHMNPQQLLYAVVAGVFLALLRHYTGSMSASIIAHCTINGWQTLLSLLYFKLAPSLGGETSELVRRASEEPVSPLAALGVSGVLAALTLPVFLLLGWIFLRRIGAEGNPFRRTAEEKAAKTRVFTWEFWAVIALCAAYEAASALSA